MKSIWMKVSGHIVEKRIIYFAQELIRKYENSDIREVHLYIPSLKAGLDERAPSILSFYITASEDVIDDIHTEIMNLLKRHDFVIIHCEKCENRIKDW